MRPNRAAWFFVAGIAWLVLRGILARVWGGFDVGEMRQQGGLVLLVPAVSLIASFAAPLFFVSFLRHHPFGDRRPLRWASLAASVAAVLSCLLVLVSFVAMVLNRGAEAAYHPAVPGWIATAVPLFFVVSIFLFLVVYAREEGEDERLRRAAAVGAVGTLIPVVTIIGWILHAQGVVVLPWFPDFSRSMIAKAMGLAAAGSLVWFLETFAVGYDR